MTKIKNNTKKSGNTRNTKVTSKTTTTKNVAPVVINEVKPHTTKTTYVAISDNIYYDGNSYRVRVRRNNVLTSKNFPSKKKAFEFRKSLLAGA